MSMVHVWWMEYRRSLLPWFALPLLVIQVWGMSSASSTWNESSTSASLAVAWPGMFIAAILGGLAALSGYTRAHWGESILANAAIPRWRIEAALITPALVVSILVPLGGLLAAWLSVPGALSSAAKGLRVEFALLAWSLSLAAIGMGHILGRLWLSRLAPGVAALIPIFLAAAMHRPDGLVFVPLLAPLKNVPSPLAVGTTVAFGLAVILTAVIGPKARSLPGGRPGFHRLPVVLGTAAALSLMVASSQLPLMVPRSGEVTPLCTVGSPHLCTYPEAIALLPTLETLSTRAANLPSELVVPLKVLEDGLQDPGQPGLILLGDPWFAAESLSTAIVNQTLGPCTAPTTPSGDLTTSWLTEYYTLEEWVSATIYGSPRPETVFSTTDPIVRWDEVDSMLGADATAQSAWVQGHLDTLRAQCGPLTP